MSTKREKKHTSDSAWEKYWIRGAHPCYRTCDGRMRQRRKNGTTTRKKNAKDMIIMSPSLFGEYLQHFVRAFDFSSLVAFRSTRSSSELARKGFGKRYPSKFWSKHYAYVFSAFLAHTHAHRQWAWDSPFFIALLYVFEWPIIAWLNRRHSAHRRTRWFCTE